MAGVVDKRRGGCVFLNIHKETGPKGTVVLIVYSSPRFVALDLLKKEANFLGSANLSYCLSLFLERVVAGMALLPFWMK